MLEGENGILEDAVAALCVRLLGGVRGQGGDDFNFVFREKLREIGVVWQASNRQVTAVYGVSTEHGGTLDDLAEVRVEFWSATCNIESGNIGLFQEVQARLEHGTRHDLLAIWSSVDMAMLACLIAFLANINLQNLNTICSEWAMTRAGGSFRERVEGQFFKDLPLPLCFGEPMPLLTQGGDDFCPGGVPLGLHGKLIYVFTHLNAMYKS